jgi:hypothetical protein
VGFHLDSLGELDAEIFLVENCHDGCEHDAMDLNLNLDLDLDLIYEFDAEIFYCDHDEMDLNHDSHLNLHYNYEAKVALLSRK